MGERREGLGEVELENAGPCPRLVPGAPFCLKLLLSSVNELRGRKALWKLTGMWKNQRTVFPHPLEPSVHSSHNADCCWIPL